MTQPIAVVLHSGGLDSTTCLAAAKADGYEPHALAFNYGQRHSAELAAATKICKSMHIQQTVLDLAIGKMGGSALTDNTIDVPEHSDGTEIPVTYVPARNLTFLSYAVGLAEVLKAEAIYIGVSSVDYSGYPDCRPEFINAFEQVANLATKAAVEGNPLLLKTPLMHLSKSETIQLGTTLGVDYSQTVSCYQADHEGRACGHCDSCALRQKGFSDAKIKDPTLYQ